MDSRWFRDTNGYRCTGWVGYSCDAWYSGYTASDMAAIRQNCPQTCNSTRRPDLRRGDLQTARCSPRAAQRLLASSDMCVIIRPDAHPR